MYSTGCMHTKKTYLCWPDPCPWGIREVANWAHLSRRWIPSHALGPVRVHKNGDQKIFITLHLQGAYDKAHVQQIHHSSSLCWYGNEFCLSSNFFVQYCGPSPRRGSWELQPYPPPDSLHLCQTDGACYGMSHTKTHKWSEERTV